MKKYLVNCMAVMLLMSTITACNGNENEPEGVTKHNGYEYVDLGLSVKWATCNIGAVYPENAGSYFAWGELEEKTDYSWVTYKWCNGTYNSITKYCVDASNGIVDNKTVLELEDDVAHAKWGGKWRMPTATEMQELIDTNKCTWIWEMWNGMPGYKVVSKLNGNSIFLPAAGAAGVVQGTDMPEIGDGAYSTSTLASEFYILMFDENLTLFTEYADRKCGHTIRPVLP